MKHKKVLVEFIEIIKESQEEYIHAFGLYQKKEINQKEFERIRENYKTIIEAYKSDGRG
jgi:hypothetical protein